MSIKEYEKEIFKQPEFLKKIQLQTQISKNKQKHILFSGSGDSLVSAMLAEIYSNFQVRSIDPLDLLKNRQFLKNNTVYFVSISGNTISNIKVAKIAKKSIAITSNIKSKLANSCNESIFLEYLKSKIVTAGSISFLSSALTCISLVKRISIPADSRIFKKALSDAKKSKIGNKIFILGNLHTFPLAIYCAAKIYEVLGYNAHYQRIEQFSHMELFSAKKGDTVIIFEGKNNHNKHFVKNLKDIGLNVIQPYIESGNKISQLLYYVYFSQLLSLFEAKKRGKKDCYFILEKKLRSASNQMIY